MRRLRATLMYLPDPVAPTAQSSEYFLTREEPETLPLTPVEIPLEEARPEEIHAEPIPQEIHAEPIPQEIHAEPVPPQFAEAKAEKAEAGTEAEPETLLSPSLRAKILEMEEELRQAREAKNARRWRQQRAPEEEPALEQSHQHLQELTHVEPELPESQVDEQPSVATPLAGMPARPVRTPAETEFRAGQFIEQAEPERANTQRTPPKIEPAPIAPSQGSDAVSREWEAIEEKVRASARDTTQEQTSMGVRFRRWLSGVGGSRARRFKRFPLPGLVAFYWTGGAPKPHEIVNISKSGFYVRTKDLWLPDTLVRMTLQRPDHNGQEGRRTIGVLARVVRIDEDGVGHEFVTSEALSRTRSQEILPEKGTSSKELERFLRMR